MDLIIETDLGRDTDDFFAICYLIASGVQVRAITISPGDPDQIAVADFLRRELGADFLIGAGIPNRDKSSATGVHTTLLQRYGAKPRVAPDMDGAALIEQTVAQYNACVFAIGPLSSLGRFLNKPENTISSLLMQGGFVGYDTHDIPVKQRLAKFEGKTTVGTFNMNGDVQGMYNLIQHPEIRKRFVGKNVCHTVEYTPETHERVMAVPSRNRAMELFREGMTLYLKNHPVKLFHDPTAAVCLLHPEIGEWVRGRVIRDKGGWGTEPLKMSSDQMLVNIKYPELWGHIVRCD